MRGTFIGQSKRHLSRCCSEGKEPFRKVMIYNNLFDQSHHLFVGQPLTLGNWERNKCEHIAHTHLFQVGPPKGEPRDLVTIPKVPSLREIIEMGAAKG
jgi:hypothetical protein